MLFRSPFFIGCHEKGLKKPAAVGMQIDFSSPLLFADGGFLRCSFWIKAMAMAKSIVNIHTNRTGLGRSNSDKKMKQEIHFLPGQKMKSGSF